MRSPVRWIQASFLIASTSLVWADQATLKPLKGQVELQRTVSSIWEPVTETTNVGQGDKVRTMAGARALLTLVDQHKVAIGPDSLIGLQKLIEGETKIFVKAGVVRSKVKKLRPEVGQYFKVQTPTAVCAVRGTDFITDVQGERTQMKTVEGSVVFGLDETKTVVVNEGFWGATDRDPVSHELIPPKPPEAIPNLEAHKVDWSRPEKWDKQKASPFGPDHPDARSGQLPPPPPPQNAGHPNGPPPPNGDAPEVVNNPNGTNPPPPTQPLPPPSGTNNPSGGDPVAQGYGILNDEINRQIASANLSNTQVNELYRSGAVRYSPLDNQMHQYVDAVAKGSPDGGATFDEIGYLNASMIAGRNDTLNYQRNVIQFNTAFPASDTYSQIQGYTQNAFSWTTTPARYAVRVETERSNGTDKLKIQYDTGVPQTVAGGGFSVVFKRGQISVSGPLVANIPGNVNGDLVLKNYDFTGTPTQTYYGGTAPQFSTNNTSTMAKTHADAFYGLGNTNNLPVIRLSREMAFFDGSGQIANTTLQANSGLTPREYLKTLTTHDILTSNVFTKPMHAFGSTLARLDAGIDNIRDDAAATAVLSGSAPKGGAPDGVQ